MRDPQIAVPTRERARELGVTAEASGWLGRTVDLLEREPEGSEALVALVVRAKVMTQTITECDDELGASALARLREERERPKARFVQGSWRALVGPVREAGVGPCSSCTFTVGRMACIPCDGTGRIWRGQGRDRQEVPCMGCGGPGQLPCARCDGDGTTVSVRVRTHHDRLETLEHVVSLAPFELHEVVSAYLSARELEAATRVDLDRPVAPLESGYRGEGAAETGRLFGLDARAPLIRARDALARLATGPVIDREVHAWAVPMTVLTYRRHLVALVAPSEHAMIGLVADRD